MMALLRPARTMTMRRRKYYQPETDPTVFPAAPGNTLDISDSSDIETLSPGDFRLEIFANNVVIIQSHTQGVTFIQLNIARTLNMTINTMAKVMSFLNILLISPVFLIKVKKLHKMINSLYS